MNTANMENNVYVLDGKSPKGPFTREHILEQIRLGNITPKTKICFHGMNIWVNAKEYFKFEENKKSEKKWKETILFSLFPYIWIFVIVNKMKKDQDHPNLKKDPETGIVFCPGMKLVEEIVEDVKNKDPINQFVQSKTEIPTNSYVIHQIERLGELKKEGLISEEEFETQKRKILS